MDRLPFAMDEADEVGAVDPGGPFVRVAVERGIDDAVGRAAGFGGGGSDEGLTYAGVDGEGRTLAVGDLVRVPLGRGNTPTRGVVIAAGGADLLGGFDARRVKRVLGRDPVGVPAELVELARWVSRYYVCPLGMVLASMIPSAVKHRVGARRVELIERAEGDAAQEAELTPTARAAWGAIRGLDDEVFPLADGELARLAGARNRGPINVLVKAGLLRRVTVDRVRSRDRLFDDPAFLVKRPEIVPSAQQAGVIAGIGAAMDAGGFSSHLLFGVTGSGKTEVYLRLIERAAEAGKSAIVLVPEIALTPQTAGRFLGRFGRETVAVLHSGLKASERHAEWARAAGGHARVIVGARSAVFAPVRDLGLIVVDEEHDGSYKQDQLPRYHGRDVAIKRAHAAGCPVVLGSATPSLESWANASGGRAGGRSTLWKLTERVGGGRLPRVEIVDLKTEPRERGVTPLVGARLRAALAQTLDAGGQAILLLNRRGYASYVACPVQSCGWVQGCDACDARMVLHRAGLRPGQNAPGGFVRCHHCLAEQKLATACPVCGKRTVTLGAGTQKAVEDIERLLAARHGLEAGRGVVRVDSDAVRGGRAMHGLLARFGAGEIRVLIGTQMIAKGLDYPNVRLVGVLNADTALAMPDFRAGERTFQLVNQVAGRAGRGEHAGLVIVQTMSPEEPAITMAAAHDYERFAGMELVMRDSAGLPPVTRMARVVCRDRDRAAAERAAGAIAAELRAVVARGLKVDGPMPCPIERIADHFRFAVEVTARDAATMLGALTALRRGGHLKSDARTAVDVDPVSLL